MPTERPTLFRALLKGSFQHFLAAFAIPVLVSGGALSLHMARIIGRIRVEEILILLGLVSLVLGTIFVFHQIVLLVAFAVERQRRRSVPPPETDLANDLFMTVVSTDLVVLLLLFGFLVWRRVEIRDVLGYFLLPIVGYYGVHLFCCRIREALAPPSTPDELSAGTSPQRSGNTLRAKGMSSLQVYATAATALLAWGAVGWPQDWSGSFGIGLVSILVGRGVERLASGWKQRQGGTNTGP